MVSQLEKFLTQLGNKKHGGELFGEVSNVALKCEGPPGRCEKPVNQWGCKHSTHGLGEASM